MFTDIPKAEELEFLKTISAIAGVVLISAILLATTTRHIWDIAALLWFPHKLFLKRYRELVDRIITDTCQRLGLVGREDRFKNIRLYDQSGLDLPDWIQQYKDRFMEVVKREAQQIAAEVGVKHKKRYSMYVDLRSALAGPDTAEELSYILIGFMRDVLREQRLTFDCVACPRTGSTILGYYASSRFDVPLLLVNLKSRWKFGDKDVFIEGRHGLGLGAQSPEVLLIDDSCSRGTTLLETADRLSKEGYKVRHAFVLFYRSEANPEQTLAQAGITLHSLLAVSDRSLKTLMGTSATATIEGVQPRHIEGDPAFEKFPFTLKRLNLYVNLTCPLRCKHCCVGPKLNHQQMTREEALEYIGMAQNDREHPHQIMILGGEPAIYPHTAEIVIAASETGAEVSLCTSGVKSEGVLAYADRLHHVSLSLDGFSARTHDLVRKPGSYDAAVRAIAAFRRTGVPVHILFTANAINVGEIDSGLRQMADHGVREVNFHVISDTGFARAHTHLLLGADKWCSARQKLDQYAGPLKIRYPLKFLKREEFEAELDSGYACMLGQVNRLNVLPGGKCYACCLFLDTDLPVGRVTDGHFRHESISECEIRQKHPSSSCPAEQILGGNRRTDGFVPMCVHWKRARGTA